MMEIHVVANGDLFREAFNALVTLIGESTFKTAFRLSVLFAVLGIAVSYIKTRDVTVFAKWFSLYFVVTVIFLGPKTSVEIFDSSNPGAVYTVDNVAYGLAFPASFITSVAYGLEKAVEEAFHMPDDATYSKTGMLFGSRVFSLSTGFHIIDPEVRADFSQYVKNCVVGDMLINKKYSMKNLVDSTDLWSLVSANPSPIRGMIFRDGSFKTCKEAITTLKTEIDNDIKKNAWTFFGIRLFGHKDQTQAANELQTVLESAGKYYIDLSQTASQMMLQNVMINGIRDGVLDYTSESGATAAMLNLSESETMQKMRMTWATSRKTITYVLPIMQTDLLLLLLCLFPIVMLITVQPGFGYKVFKSYFYSLLWIESWPMLFSFLNLAVTFYIHDKTQGLAGTGFTLSNSNQLALEHSDVANMAGYLMTCVPFIAIGIVKGMDSAFSSAAQYIGGMIHSTAGAAASEVATGNLSLGNASYNNVNANKFDTNSTFMHGMATEQLPNGGSVTHTASGADVWNVSPAISHLATSVKAGEMMSASYSKQAESSEAAARQEHVSYDHSVANAASHLEQFASSSSSQQGYGENYATGNTNSVEQHASRMHGTVENVARHNGITYNEAFKGLTSISENLGLSGEASLHTPTGGKGIFGAGGSLNVGVGTEHSRSNEESVARDTGININVSNEDLKNFSNDWSAIQNYSSSKHADIGHSLNNSELTQLAADLRETKNHAEGFSANLNKSERLSDLANFTSQRSAQIDEDSNQGFAEYVQKTIPGNSTAILSNTNDPQIASQREQLAEQYINSPEMRGKIDAMYQQQANRIQPSEIYQRESAAAATKDNGKLLQKEYNEAYNKVADDIKQQGHKEGTDFNNHVIENTKQEVNSGRQDGKKELQNSFSKNEDAFNQAKIGINDDIKEGNKKADLSSFGDFKFWEDRSIKPKFVEKKEK
ncbi:MAG: hypothetical protein A2X78_01560 [Gammaproteobacteria bacterium GWE2_37_16]|nr:MAG: hypothetical protein A2X78_01560 [Gammaproteobacteria bacterium GWE2_37_16]